MHKKLENSFAACREVYLPIAPNYLRFVEKFSRVSFTQGVNISGCVGGRVHVW